MQLVIHIPDETAALLQSRGVKITALIKEPLDGGAISRGSPPCVATSSSRSR